jgi:hypothetical protein
MLHAPWVAGGQPFGYSAVLHAVVTGRHSLSGVLRNGYVIICYLPLDGMNELAFSSSLALNRRVLAPTSS